MRGELKVIRPIEGLALSEYLALEAELVKTVNEPTLFTWIVAPTVIYGRHQHAETEVNEAYCAEHGIQVVQRKSGGGCVYADRGNLMVSYLEPKECTKDNVQCTKDDVQCTKDDVQCTKDVSAYERFMGMLAGAIRRLGYEAVTTAHNDVLVGDRKVSGTACYTTPTGTVVHACVLYKVNIEALEQAITPTQAKLAKHGVASVRQRVRNLGEIRDLGDIQAFREAMEEQLSIEN